MPSRPQADRPFPKELEKSAACFALLKELREAEENAPDESRPPLFPCCPKFSTWNPETGIWRCKHGRRRLVTKGTLFEGTSNRITQWFKAIWLVTSRKQGGTARELQAGLGWSYATAYDCRKKLRKLMGQEESLGGDIELEVVQIPGVPKKGRKSQFVLIALKPHAALWQVRLASPKDPHPATVVMAVKPIVTPGSTLRTTSWPGFEELSSQGYRHIREYRITVPGQTMTDRASKICRDLDRHFSGIFHNAVDDLDPYVKEYAFRYNLHFSDQDDRLFRAVLKLAAREIRTL